MVDLMSLARSEALPYASAFFVTIATTLGTGILGLPVKLSQSGVAPSVFVLTLVLGMQLAVAALMVELLQRAAVTSAAAAAARPGGAELGLEEDADGADAGLLGAPPPPRRERGDTSCLEAAAPLPPPISARGAAATSGGARTASPGSG